MPVDPQVVSGICEQGGWRFVAMMTTVRPHSRMPFDICSEMRDRQGSFKTPIVLSQAVLFFGDPSSCLLRFFASSRQVASQFMSSHVMLQCSLSFFAVRRYSVSSLVVLDVVSFWWLYV